MRSPGIFAALNEPVTAATNPPAVSAIYSSSYMSRITPIRQPPRMPVSILAIQPWDYCLAVWRSYCKPGRILVKTQWVFLRRRQQLHSLLDELSLVLDYVGTFYEPYFRLRSMRLIFLLLAYLFVALAIIGIFMPGLPTVPFVLAAAWFSARGSERLHRWLYAHPQLGKMLIDWEQHGAISRSSKTVAVLMLAISWLLMLQRVDDVAVLAAAAVFSVGLSIFLVSRPEPG